MESIKTWLQKQIPDLELNGLLKPPPGGAVCSLLWYLPPLSFSRPAHCIECADFNYGPSSTLIRKLDAGNQIFFFSPPYFSWRNVLFFNSFFNFVERGGRGCRRVHQGKIISYWVAAVFKKANEMSWRFPPQITEQYLRRNHFIRCRFPQCISSLSL